MNLTEVLEEKGLTIDDLAELDAGGIDYESASPSIVVEEGEAAAEIRIRIPHGD